MPLRPEPVVCWVLLVHQECTGELLDFHWPSGDGASIAQIDRVRWALFAHDPSRNPPQPELHDGPCLVVVCRGCGMLVGDGEHFADAEHAWKAAAEDGWQADECPFCQPSPDPV